MTPVVAVVVLYQWEQHFIFKQCLLQHVTPSKNVNKTETRKKQCCTHHAARISDLIIK